MLGSLNTNKKWEWCATGKHPAGRDYFRTDSHHPLLNAFTEWMEKGYHQLKTRPDFGRTLYSWRFWSKGALPDTLVCGIIRDSSDGLGRPYPLLIMGTGPLIKWQSHSELLPFALEKTWKQMESLGVGRYTDIQSLKEEIYRLVPPEADWKSLNRHLAESELMNSNPSAPHPGKAINRLLLSRAPVSKPDQRFIEIKNTITESSSDMAGAYGLQLKKQAVDLPSTFLMGGIPEKSYLAFFFRPWVSGTLFDSGPLDQMITVHQ